jgi:hypothetical protein
MGEHTSNLLALLAKTLPAFPPPDRDGQMQIGWMAQPKPNVLVLLKSDIREMLGSKQFRRSDDSEWKNLPPDLETHPLGEPLPIEKCDVVFGLVAMWADTHAERMGQQRGNIFGLPGEFARMDMRAFLKRAEASLPAERRIVAPPGLGLVP